MGKSSESKASPEVIAALNRKPLKLDREKPYAEVCGLPGAAFTQDGSLFNTQGYFVDPKNCTEIQDDPDKPQSEEYTGYNQVILVESEPASGKPAPSFSEAVIYGETRE